MPRLNSAGQATTGYQKTWFDDTRTLDVVNTLVGTISLSDGTPIITTTPILNASARDGQWVAEVEGKLIGSWGEIPEGALDGYADPIGPDGSLVYKIKRNSFGPWRFFKGPTFGGDCRGTQNLGGGKAVWLEGDWVIHSNFDFSHDGKRAYSIRIKEDDVLYQSADGGTLVLNGHVIAPGGNYHRPDFRRVGDAFNIVWSPVEGEPSLMRMSLTMGELRGLPLVATAVEPTPQLPPPIPIEVHPVPEIPNKLDVVKQVRAKYPTPLRDSHWKFLVDVAQRTGARLLRKSGGTRVAVPGLGDVSQDIIVFGTTGVDILTDGENTAGPVWQVKEGETFVDTFDVSDVSLGDTGGNPPVGDHAEPGLDEVAVNKLIGAAIARAIGPVHSLIGQLTDKTDDLQDDLTDLQDDLTELNKAVEELNNRPLRTVRTTANGFGPLKHSHEVTL